MKYCLTFDARQLWQALMRAEAEAGVRDLELLDRAGQGAGLVGGGGRSRSGEAADRDYFAVIGLQDRLVSGTGGAATGAREGPCERWT